MGPGEGGPPPYLMGLRLTDDQQDKVFGILHEAAPQLRAQSKAAHQAREALHALSQSVRYAPAAAAPLAQAQGTAETQLALLHARIDHDIYAVLDDAQRARLADHRPERPPPGAAQ